jgi:hypothetical protein
LLLYFQMAAAAGRRGGGDPGGSPGLRRADPVGFPLRHVYDHRQRQGLFPAHGKDYYANSAVTDPDWRMLVPIGVFTLVNIVFGLFPAPVMHFLAQIAAGRI